MQPIDLLIEARWALPMDDADAIGHAALAVDGGRIVAIGAAAALAARFAPRERIQRPRHALLPGLVNAHTHAAMSLLRGLPVRGPRMQWLNETIWPYERRSVNAQFVRSGTQLAMAEMLAAGITCFADMYYFPDEVARLARARHLRAVVGAPIVGYRAPTFSLVRETAWGTDVLTDLGYSYSSSVLPARSPLHGFPGLPRDPFTWPSGLVELPCPCRFAPRCRRLLTAAAPNNPFCTPSRKTM